MKQRLLLMLTLVVAGELVFGLAFNVPRFFKPTMLEVFGITNTQLGDVFAVYGVVALLAYFPGGALADRFSARSLIAASLIATSAGGLYMLGLPGLTGMAWLYGYWGFTTIFLFWGALIRATRDWGGETQQGVAFGILDGGRGLVAAAVAYLAVWLLSGYLPENADYASAAERAAGFRAIVLLYTVITFLSGLLAFFVIPRPAATDARTFRPLHGMGQVLQRPDLWALALIIVCAYCGYKGLDNYSLYAHDVLGMDEVKSAKLASDAAWLRPVAAVTAGLIADRVGATRSIGALFAILTVFFTGWSLQSPDTSAYGLVYVNFFATFFFVFAFRGVYFAVLEEGRTPKRLTGAAVGMISLIGFAPDVFFAAIAGRILDASPGLAGFRDYFIFLAGIMAAGALAVLVLLFLHRRRKHEERRVTESTAD